MELPFLRAGLGGNVLFSLEKRPKGPVRIKTIEAKYRKKYLSVPEMQFYFVIIFTERSPPVPYPGLITSCPDSLTD